MSVPHIIAGFDLDCNALFIKFEKLSSVRYETFADIWTEMKFSLIFSGRRVKELVCFTTEALHYTKYFLLQSSSFLRRVCALYIIYGIYYKQPVKNTSKIFVTMEEWVQIKEFLVILKENDHFDALYILLTLLFDNAFEFSATNSIRYTPMYCRGVIHTNYEDLDDFQNLELNNLTKELETIEQNYLEAKIELSASLNIPYINYGNDNFSKELKEILEAKPPNTTQNSNIAKPGTSKQTKESYAEKRRRLREKSFKKKSKATLYRSSVVKNDESVSDDEYP